MACFHCALPVSDPGRYRVKVDGSWRPVCCPGCEAVASAILGYGLQGYYEHRTSPAPTAEAGAEGEDFHIYDDPEVQRGFVHTAANGECDAALMLEGVRCTACVWLNQRVLERLPGVRGVGINATTHRAQLSWDPQKIKLSEILAAVRRIGYRAHPYDVRQQEVAQRTEQKQSLLRLFVAAFGMMQVTMYAFPVYLAEPGSMTPDIVAADALGRAGPHAAGGVLFGRPVLSISLARSAPAPHGHGLARCVGNRGCIRGQRLVHIHQARGSLFRFRFHVRVPAAVRQISGN